MDYCIYIFFGKYITLYLKTNKIIIYIYINIISFNKKNNLKK